MSSERVSIEPMEPPRCEWYRCRRLARFLVSLNDGTALIYHACGLHTQPMATALIDAADRKAAAQRRQAREAEERRARAQRAQDERDRDLRERVKSAHERGEVYPLVLPPGIPGFLREQIQAEIIEGR